MWPRPQFCFPTTHILTAVWTARSRTREELRAGGGKKVVGLTLLKRPGQVEDVASIAVMLASDEQNYMTGQTISPNGGSYFVD